jgi:hypothetical protein
MSAHELHMYHLINISLSVFMKVCTAVCEGWAISYDNLFQVLFTLFRICAGVGRRGGNGIP